MSAIISTTLSRPAGRRRRYSPLMLLILPLVLFLGLFFVWPILGLLKQGFYVHGVLSADNYRHLLTTPIYRIVLQNTFIIALAVTGCCVVMSYPLAYLMATVRPALAKLLFFAVLLPFWSSALVRTSAWIALLQQNGPLNRLLVNLSLIDHPIAFLYNFNGVLIGMTHVLMPFVVLPLYASFRSMDGALILAAKSLGADAFGVLFKVVLPVTRPGMVAGAIMVFMNAVGYYITPSLMGGPGQRMIAELISHNITDELNWGIAAALAGVLLFITLCALWVFNRLFGLGRLMAPLAGKGSASAVQRRGVGGGLCVVAGGVCALFLILPILVVIPMSFGTGSFPTFPPPGYGLRWYLNFFAQRKWMAALWQSVQVTLLAMVLGATAALGMHKLRSAHQGWLDALFIIPMSVPAIITAVALYYLCGPLGLMANSAALVIGHTVLAVPYCYLTVRTALQGFDANLELAARSLGAGWRQLWVRIMLPALLPGLVGGAVIAFITSFDDVVMALFLTTLRNRTLPKLMYEGLAMDFDPTVIAASCLLIALTAAILIAHSVLSRKGAKHATVTR